MSSRLAALLLLLAAPATAQTQAFIYATTGPWTVEALRDDAGFTGCAGRSTQTDGNIIIGTAADGWYVTVPSPESAQAFRGGVLRFDMGDRIDVQYAFNPDLTATAWIDDSLVDRIADAGRLRTRINGVVPSDWSMAGSRAMIDLVRQCLRREGKPPD